MRLLSSVLLAAGLFACGTPCSHIAGAEAQANDKASKNCGGSSGTWSDAKIKSCEAGLSKCSQDDQKAMENYADCLTKLPECVSGQSINWSLQRVSCLQALNISLSCAQAIN